jgi:hypothetical protein
MMVWTAVGIALLIFGMVAFISGQGRISLNLLCILESAEEKIRWRRGQNTKVVSRARCQNEHAEIEVRQHLPELTTPKVDVPPCAIMGKNATQLRARSAFRG